MGGLETNTVGLISAEALHDIVAGDVDFVLLDVRAPQEYGDTYIAGAINIPVADLRTRYMELNQDKTTILICSSRNRSSLGASILKQHGFKMCIMSPVG